MNLILSGPLLNSSGWYLLEKFLLFEWSKNSLFVPLDHPFLLAPFFLVYAWGGVLEGKERDS